MTTTTPDWIKFRNTLDSDPRVFKLRRIMSGKRPANVRPETDARPDESAQGAQNGAPALLAVYGALAVTWWFFDRQSTDGRIEGVSKADLDDHVRWPGWADAMMEIGWLEIDGQTLVLPRFDEHNGKTAKGRLVDAARKRGGRSPDAQRTDGGRSPDKRRTKSKSKSKKGEEEEANSAPSAAPTGPTVPAAGGVAADPPPPDPPPPPPDFQSPPDRTGPDPDPGAVVDAVIDAFADWRFRVSTGGAPPMLNAEERSQVERWFAALPDGGHEIAEAAVQDAADCGADFDNVPRACRYAGAIVAGCVRDGRLPGARGPSPKAEADRAAAIDREQLERERQREEWAAEAAPAPKWVPGATRRASS